MPGGCGACVVLLSKYDPVVDEVKDFTASSCLTLLCSINGCSITTSEGLGNIKDGFHPIHQRIAGFHASQCGFCTPSMCVSLFGALVNAEKTNRPDPPPGFSKLSVSEAEKSIAGNLCRCTGYRPIADACKSFAADVDMEDLGFNSFWKKGDSKEVKVKSLPPYNRNGDICTFPDFLKKEIRSSMPLDPKRYGWYNPVRVEELQNLLKDNDFDSANEMKLVVGNTGTGYYKELKRYDRYIDLRCVPELSMIKIDPTGAEFGAIVTISKVIESLRKNDNGGSPSRGGDVLKNIAIHMEKIASGFIRNTASIGGNLVMAQRKCFPSDIATILLAVDSEVDIMNGARSETIMLEDFLRRPPLDPKSVLLSVKIPNWEAIRKGSRETNTMLLFETYRAAPRPLGSALAYLNAAFLAEVSFWKISNGIMVDHCRLAFGAYGTKHAIRARKVEEFLTGKVLSPGVLYDAIKLVRDAVVPEEGTTSPAYRSSLAAGFIFEFFSPLIDSEGSNRFLGNTSLANASKLKRNKSASDKMRTVLSSGKQVIELSTEYDPVGKPITKSGGLIQASADTQKHADMATNFAVVDYGMEDTDPPILSVEEAVKRASFFEVPPFLYPKQVGDISNGMAAADHKIISAEIKLGSQCYFYMETQTALAVPYEENCMVVYTSSQGPEYAHSTIAKCLGIPENNIRVITRRVGGGFGGKGIQSVPVATACALAAHKLHRPVRMYLDRKTDMIMAGGRHPMKITYSVGFKSDGKITALELEILINAGISIGFSPVLPRTILWALKKYDWGALAFDIKVCKTNTPSRSTMRAPGEVQGSFIAEAVIEHVASTLSIEVDYVRSVNLHTSRSLDLFYEHSAGEPLEYTLPLIWNKLAMSSSFNPRTEMVKEFNRCTKWQKRGISRVPILCEVSLRPTPGKVSILSDGSVVVEVGGIELGQGLWTKVKQVTAFALGSIQCDGSGDLSDKVRVVQSDTLSLIQGGITVGSTTSEASCEAVRLCCNILVERLATLKGRLKEQMGSINWETLIQQASLQDVNLSASSYYVPDFASKRYLNYGAAVEVNVLTGQTRILQSDIIYDCGQSLNPAVDLGQIEGAFVQGIGFFMLEEYSENSDGLVISEGTWTYKIPTMDTIPKRFNVEVLSSGHHKKRVLSSKASGEPPLLLAVSVHCATRAAIKESRKQLLEWGGLDGSASIFQLDVPATMPVVKELCGLEAVERYLEWIVGRE
ncbi:hypothetical protein DVH24_005522 [Malus domestica]|uniref:indole-3-acetaldehyde oxidase n=1 Tax=Malus domestica TaxID=3750 RepID=A0A498IJD7_MALDO|nr:hypothetical protein DVH24_005522 [Malus domestica]